MRIIKLPFKIKRPILACGADLKGAFALAKGDEAYLFDGFGDLADLDDFTKYEKAVKSAMEKLGISPKIIACDLHPNYFSARFAGKIGTDTYFSTAHTIEKWVSVPFFCQHHEAHVASAIVDNSIKGDVIGIAFDGTGYGNDGSMWGGEFFVGNSKKFTRAAYFEYIPMPGGEMAIKEPWRMAASYLSHVFGNRFLKLDIEFIKRLNKKEWAILKKMIENKLNSPPTSSSGRLFDAAGSLVLARMSVEKEAELPIELERIAIELCRDAYEFDIRPEDKGFVVNCKKIIKGIVGDLSKNVDRPTISSKFHNTIAEIISKVSARLRKKFKTNKVVLSGGVFQNTYLTSRARRLLINDGFKVFTHLKVPTNDSGIPVGQIAIANARIRCA